MDHSLYGSDRLSSRVTCLLFHFPDSTNELGHLQQEKRKQGRAISEVGLESPLSNSLVFVFVF